MWGICCLFLAVPSADRLLSWRAAVFRSASQQTFLNTTTTSTNKRGVSDLFSGSLLQLKQEIKCNISSVKCVCVCVCVCTKHSQKHRQCLNRGFGSARTLAALSQLHVKYSTSGTRRTDTPARSSLHFKYSSLFQPSETTGMLSGLCTKISAPLIYTSAASREQTAP